MINVNITNKDYSQFSVVRYTPAIKWQENCYLLVFSGGECLIIDPGFACEGIPSFIVSHGYVARKILLTHAHHDHLACAELISSYFSIPCAVDEKDKRILMHAPMYGMRFAGQKVERPQNIEWLTAALRQEMLSEYALKIIRTPGHTPGGICLMLQEAIFTGDTLVRGYTGRTDLPGSDLGEINASITRLLEQDGLSDETDIYPGHGKPWTIREAREWWRKENYSEQKQF